MTHSEPPKTKCRRCQMMAGPKDGEYVPVSLFEDGTLPSPLRFHSGPGLVPGYTGIGPNLAGQILHIYELIKETESDLFPKYRHTAAIREF